MPTDQSITSDKHKAKRAARERAYRSTQEYKAKRTARESTPEYKAKKAARDAKPERKARKLALERAYRSTPGYKAKRTARESTLKYKAKKAARDAKPGRHSAIRKRQWKYGLNPDEQTAMIAACNGRCPCCKVPFSKILGEHPCFDHNHKIPVKRKAVRGVICRTCNFILGHAHDNPKILRACARYLERFQKEEQELSHSSD